MEISAGARNEKKKNSTPPIFSVPDIQFWDSDSKG